MKKSDLTIIRLCCILTLGIVLQSRGAAQELCSTVSLGVQVLGSGGPFAGTNRASSGYLVWREGRAVVMVDAGGGTYVRFGEAGARLNDLSLLAISHLHPDHVAAVQEAFSPSEDEVTRARRVTEAARESKGVFMLDGVMVDRPGI